MSPRIANLANISLKNAAPMKSNIVLNEEQLKEFTYILIKNLEAKKVVSEVFNVICFFLF